MRKIAEVMRKIAEVMRKIAEVLRRIAEVMHKIAEVKCKVAEVMYFLKCIFLKCFLCIFANCTRLACLLSFASLSDDSIKDHITGIIRRKSQYVQQISSCLDRSTLVR